MKKDKPSKKQKIEIKTEEGQSQKFNAVRCGDFGIQSNTSSLNKCVKELKELIKEFTEFHNTRIANKLRAGWGGIG